MNSRRTAPVARPVLSVEAGHAVSEHPCYGEAAHARYARLHLPVAPRCNITCAYCDRRVGDCVHGAGPTRRPGLSARIVAPAEVPDLVRTTLRAEPRLRVIGIAGPGEPLANPETFEALALAGKAWEEAAVAPKPVFCLSTNGLLLAEAVPKLVRLGVITLTVTLNAVTPDVAGRIYLWVPYASSTGDWTAGSAGGPAADQTARLAWFVGRQLAGIRRAAAAGLVVKVNTVLIPGVNDGPGITEIRHVARAAARAGAYIQNIIPLIPLGAFAHLRAPTCDELRWARDAASRYLPQFRLCRQCRADAAGVPAEEPGGP